MTQHEDPKVNSNPPKTPHKLPCDHQRSSGATKNGLWPPRMTMGPQRPCHVANTKTLRSTQTHPNTPKNCCRHTRKGSRSPRMVWGHQDQLGVTKDDHTATKNDHRATTTMPRALSQPKAPTRRPQGQPKSTQEPPQAAVGPPENVCGHQEWFEARRMAWGHQKPLGDTLWGHHDRATSPIPGQGPNTKTPGSNQTPQSCCRVTREGSGPPQVP